MWIFITISGLFLIAELVLVILYNKWSLAGKEQKSLKLAPYINET